MSKILSDQFTLRGVCSFCRTAQVLHEESRLCRSCLSLARVGWVPDHIKNRDTKPAPTAETKLVRRRRRCSECRYTVAGWQLCSRHWQEQHTGVVR